MSLSLNWGLIRTGGTFEGLMQTIVFFKDPKAVLFGRSGIDGGQDALSGDGKTVYQAKYNKKESFAVALSDAKKELAKICKYREPGHPRFEQWEGVDKWTLVTNACVNPGDHEKWLELVPEFNEKGLETTYWSQETLTNEMVSLPEVRRAYFESENRNLLAIPEARERLLDQEYFLKRDSLPSFGGRQTELAAFQDFIRSANRFLVIHGAGGTGKSRLLLEGATRSALEDPLQVFWGNVETMSRSTRWFEAMVPERPSLLVLDEPEDPKFLKALLEQISTRATDWKLVVGVRSLKSPILEIFKEPQNKRRTAKIPLAPLTREDANSFARNLLENGVFRDRDNKFKDEVADYLTKRFEGFPVWICLAVSLLEEMGHLNALPQNVSDLAEDYLGRIHGSLPEADRGSYLGLLRWLSLLGTFNSELGQHQNLLMQVTGLNDLDLLKNRLHKLKNLNLLRARGARNRLLEVKPDVIRDHILVRWLTLEVGEDQLAPSPEAKNLCQRAVSSLLVVKTSGDATFILETLARTQFYLKLSGVQVQLLDPFFQTLDSECLQLMTTRTLAAILRSLHHVAMFCPTEVVAVCHRIRCSHQSDPGRLQILHELASCLKYAAMPVIDPKLQGKIVAELVEVGAEETKADGHPTDTTQALKTVLAGGPNFRAGYDASVSKRLAKELDFLRQSSWDPDRSSAVFALCGCYLEVERRWSIYQTPKLP